MPREMDAIDRRILECLQANARISNHELAERVGLSPSPCLRRVRQLEADNLISAYVAVLNAKELGLSVTAFVRVRLNQQVDASLTEFEDEIASMPEVLDCYLMTGDCDYQLRVMLTSLEEYEDFLRKKLTKISLISQVDTSFAIRPIVNRSTVPLPAKLWPAFWDRLRRR